ncbi:MAG: hypothetical protein ACR2IV_07835 [Bryobacteraceae bacterium]
MKNAGEALGPGPAFLEKLEAQQLPGTQYTASLQANPGKWMKARRI